VTVIAVYWLLRRGAPPLTGFVLATLATFVGTSAIYVGLIRPFWFVRPFFGMKMGPEGHARLRRPNRAINRSVAPQA
jgi:glucans biosynthesis protein C